MGAVKLLDKTELAAELIPALERYANKRLVDANFYQELSNKDSLFGGIKP